MDTSVLPQPGLPASPGENTTAMVHYYRAEVARMSSWRDRLDRTTNWAITVVAALLSVSLSTPTAHHGVLLFALLLVSLLLYVEGRRYRFYDVYRMRVRQFEKHYFAQLFSADVTDVKASPWLDMLAQDLRHPRFRVSFTTALTRRLKRNYIWLYVIVLLGWLLKITSPRLSLDGVSTEAPFSIFTAIGNAALGPLPGWVVIPMVLIFYALLALATRRGRRKVDDDEVHV